MKTHVISLTAGEAVRAGMCDGKCLVASERKCDCTCGGVYHGQLAAEVIGQMTLTASIRAEPIALHSTDRPNGSCAECGGAIPASARRDSKTCSDRCRKRAHRARARQQEAVS